MIYAARAIGFMNADINNYKFIFTVARYCKYTTI